MFRHLFLRDQSHACRLASAFRAADDRGRSAWPWIWTLYISRGAEDLDETREIVRRSLNLRQFTAMCDVPSSLLAALQSCRSLQRLEVWIDPLSHEAVKHIGAFKNLHELNLMVSCWDPDNITAPLADAPPWTLPFVRTLHWAYPPGDTYQETVFLSRCSFPSLEMLILAPCAPHPKELPYFGQFLDAHPQIIHLEVHTEVDRLVHIASFIRSPSVALISKSGECPDAAIVSVLRPEVKLLMISGGAEEGYGRLLTAIAAMDRTRPGLLEVRLIWLASQGGPPAAGGPERSRLRGHAHLLRKRGIRLFAGADDFGPSTTLRSHAAD
jgi:hypothetical protein